MSPGTTLRELLRLRYSHRHGGDSADNVPVGWITNLTDLPSRLRTGNQNELVPVKFTPATGISVSEFDKIDRTVEFVLPAAWLYLVLPGINFDERPRSNERKECVILKSDVSTKTVLQVHLLQ